MFESNPGRLTGQFLKAIGIANGVPGAAQGYVEGQAAWSDTRKEISKAIHFHKAAVTSITAGGSGLEFVDVGTSFLSALRPVSVASRFTSAKSVPLFTRIINWGSGAVGVSNIGEGMPIPMSRPSSSAITVMPRKTVAMVTMSKDLLKFARPGTEESITADLAAAAGAAEDVAFLSPAVAGSVLYGITPIASSGSTLSAIDADLKAAIAVLVAGRSTLAASVWIMSPTTATNLSLLRGSGGQPAYPDITVRGGTLAGLPVLVSAGVSGYIALIDQAAVFLSPAQVALDTTEEAAMELSDAPTENSTTPTAAQVVSLFQTDSVALRAIVYRGWELVVPGLATYIAGAAY